MQPEAKGTLSFLGNPAVGQVHSSTDAAGSQLPDTQVKQLVVQLPIV